MAAIQAQIDAERVAMEEAEARRIVAAERRKLQLAQNARAAAEEAMAARLAAANHRLTYG